jgi:hypothetical protein
VTISVGVWCFCNNGTRCNQAGGEHLRDVEDVVDQLAARGGRTVTRAQRGEVYDAAALEFDVDAAIPARQMKCVPMEQTQGFHVIATDVRVEGAVRAYKYSAAAPATPWLRLPAIRVEFAGGLRDTTSPNNARAAAADSIEL